MLPEIKRVNDILEKRETELLMELDDICHLIECGSLKNYNTMFQFAASKHFDYVCDIGCAYGHQSELCRDLIKYIGIDEDSTNFYEAEGLDTTYIVGHYPCEIEIPNKYKTLAVSILCLGWNCYRYNDDEYDRQFKALSKDFAACLLYVPTEREEDLKKYFNHVEIIEEHGCDMLPTAIYYCYNTRKENENENIRN